MKNIILDTNALIWFANGDNRLSSSAVNFIENTSINRLVSVASIWEMAIKTSIGKLKLNFDLDDLPKNLQQNGFAILDISYTHALGVRNLEWVHRDPFDRIILAQALAENADIVSVDGIFDQYLKNSTIKRLW